MSGQPLPRIFTCKPLLMERVFYLSFWTKRMKGGITMPVTEEMLHMVRRYIHEKPTIGLILGSGLGEFAEQMENKRTVPYEEIPHFPVSTVSGHSGQLICGEVEGATILAMQGRFHYYEGYSMEEVILPVRLMKKLGVRALIVTNAAGIVAKSFSPGDLMLMTDHLNF